METIKYQVYAKIDSKNSITHIISSPFLTDASDWILIDEGENFDKYYHAQSNYLEKSIYTEDGIPRYKLVDGKAVERTSEEIEADKPKPPEPQPTIEDLKKENELLKAQIQAQSDRNDFMEDCIAEIAMQLYS